MSASSGSFVIAGLCNGIGNTSVELNESNLLNHYHLVLLHKPTAAIAEPKNRKRYFRPGFAHATEPSDMEVL